MNIRSPVMAQFRPKLYDVYHYMWWIKILNNSANFQTFLIKFCTVIAILFSIVSCKFYLNRLSVSYFIMKRVWLQFISNMLKRVGLRMITADNDDVLVSWHKKKTLSYTTEVPSHRPICPFYARTARFLCDSIACCLFNAYLLHAGSKPQNVIELRGTNLRINSLYTACTFTLSIFYLDATTYWHLQLQQLLKSDCSVLLRLGPIINVTEFRTEAYYFGNGWFYTETRL